MGRPAKLAVAALNIRIVSPENRDYPSLLRALFRLRLPVKVRGTEHLVLTKFGKTVPAEEKMGFGGIIGKFTDIPQDAEWLDTDTLSAADADQLSDLVIPANLKPNYHGFRFGLFEKEHIVVFEVYAESNSLSPFQVEKFFNLLVKSRKIKNEFGRIEVDLIPDYDQLEKILDSEYLKSIAIDIYAPNPDDFDDAQFQRTEERMRALNAEREQILLTAPKGESLNLDAETKSLARVAAENGSVSAKVVENGLSVPLSTDEHPLEVRDTYDSEEMVPEPIFRRLAKSLVARARRNRRRTAQE